MRFLFGFAIGYLPSLYFLVHFPAITSGHPAQYGSEHITVVLEALQPTASSKSQVLATKDDSLKPAQAPKPTSTPTLPATPRHALSSSGTAAGAVETSAPRSPSPAPTPDVWSPPEYEPWFTQYAAMYGVDKNVLERIANCESHFKPNAVSPNGVYLGLFQFSAPVWQKYRTRMGADPDSGLRANPEEAIKTAAYVVSVRELPLGQVAFDDLPKKVNGV